MGTNYYLKRIPTKEEIEKTKNLLDQGKIESTSDRWGWDFDRDCAAQDMINIMTESIHIGKQSYGWAFSFRANDDIYERSYDSVFGFIDDAVASGNWMLVDEYGDGVVPMNFKNMVLKNMDKMTHFTDPENSSYFKYVKDTESISEDGSWWTDNDFC